MSPRRKNNVRQIVEQYGKETLLKTICELDKHEFLKGKNWFNFDWFIKPDYFEKLISGNYEKIYTTEQKQAQPRQQSDAERRLHNVGKFTNTKFECDF